MSGDLVLPPWAQTREPEQLADVIQFPGVDDEPPVVHIAGKLTYRPVLTKPGGSPVVIGVRVRQLCSWCGLPLIDTVCTTDTDGDPANPGQVATMAIVEGAWVALDPLTGMPLVYGHSEQGPPSVAAVQCEVTE